VRVVAIGNAYGSAKWNTARRNRAGPLAAGRRGGVGRMASGHWTHAMRLSRPAVTGWCTDPDDPADHGHGGTAVMGLLRRVGRQRQVRAVIERLPTNAAASARSDGHPGHAGGLRDGPRRLSGPQRQRAGSTSQTPPGRPRRHSGPQAQPCRPQGPPPWPQAVVDRGRLVGEGGRAVSGGPLSSL
jgi:hypothetical protein